MDTHQSQPNQKQTTSQTITWRNIQLDVIHTTGWRDNIEHIEVRSENKIAIPITDTGYLSHFLSVDQVSEYGDAATYVLAWLDHEEQSDEWKRKLDQSRQLTLF